MVEQKVYTPAFRRMVAKAYYTSNKSHVEIGKEFNTSAANVSRWSRLYRHEFLGELSIRQESATFNAVSNLSPTMNKPDLTPEQMAQRILELEAQLKQEQMRSAVLETMIDLAESDLKISIQKNLEPNSPSSQGASSTVWTACTLRTVWLYPSGILRTIEIQANQDVGVGYHPDAGSCGPRRFSPHGG